ncbi:MAG TPA: hypothetical protein VMM36_06155 [Opitutaceae bacterium]|nr:hypothetical protein [Opitutaceae bacterium]
MASDPGASGWKLRAGFVAVFLPILIEAPCAFGAKVPVLDPSPIRKVAEYQLNYGRTGAAAAALGDYIYIFGGSGGTFMVERAERLNVRTGEVELLAPRFRTRRMHGVVEYGGKFHIIGGQTLDVPEGALDDTIEVYDPVTDTVSFETKMPDPRQIPAPVVVGDDLYILGGGRLHGRNTYISTNDVRIYNFKTGEWRQGPLMPTARFAYSAPVGQFVLVAGGRSQGNKLKTVEMLVPSENVWKKLPDLGMAVFGCSMIHAGRWLFFFGDIDEDDLVLAYDLPTRKTYRVKCGFAGAIYSTAVVHENRIYLISGRSFYLGSWGGTERGTIQVFELAADDERPQGQK